MGFWNSRSPTSYFPNTENPRVKPVQISVPLVNWQSNNNEIRPRLVGFFMQCE